jgi:hypothetical protein
VDKLAVLVHSLCTNLWKPNYFARKPGPELGKHFKQPVQEKYFSAFSIHSLNAAKRMDGASRAP